MRVSDVTLLVRHDAHAKPVSVGSDREDAQESVAQVSGRSEPAADEDMPSFKAGDAVWVEWYEDRDADSNSRLAGVVAKEHSKRPGTFKASHVATHT